MTSGWPCPQCSNVMAPFIISCPFCAKTAGSPVPGFKPGDRVWPNPDGPMALQRAPQAVIAAYRDPVLGSWLWLDAGLGSFGSYAAAFWTTEEPGDAEKSATAARVRQREEENRRAPLLPRPRREFRGSPSGPGAVSGVPFMPVDGPCCCACGSTAVTYRNYADLSFCGTCANGEPLGNMRPCPPHERDPEESTVLLQLPAYMAGGRQLARLDGDWREVLPGLQARLTDEGRVQADVEFRLAPQDGQDRD